LSLQVWDDLKHVWIYTFLCKFYENQLKYAWNSNNSEATKQSYWIWMKIQVFNENYESVCRHRGNSSHVGPQTNFDGCTMLNSMSNSLSSKTLMKLNENLVEICPILWLPNGFCSPNYWVWCQIQVLVENLCNYMKIWFKYILFGGH